MGIELKIEVDLKIRAKPKIKVEPILLRSLSDLLNFQKVGLNNLVSKKLVLAKENNVLKRKKTPRLIQNKLGITEKKNRRENFSDSD